MEYHEELDVNVIVFFQEARKLYHTANTFETPLDLWALECCFRNYIAILNKVVSTQAQSFRKRISRFNTSAPTNPKVIAKFNYNLQYREHMHVVIQTFYKYEAAHCWQEVDCHLVYLHFLLYAQ